MPSLAASDAREHVVRVRGFVKRYGKRAAVLGVDLAAYRGQIYGIIGPDGAGKSTLLKAIAGVLAHDAGELEVLGVRVHDERSADLVKGRLGFMPQGLGLSLYPELSVEENVDFFAAIRGVPARVATERKARLLAMTRLDGFLARPMRQLSGGMKQKLALVCTLVHEPDLVILDEPTTGVDPLSRRDFWALLSTLVRERNVAALVSTAYLDEASRCDRVLLLHAGKCLAEDEPDRLRRALPGVVVQIATEQPDPTVQVLRAASLDAYVAAETVRAFVPGASAGDARARIAELLAIEPGAVETAAPELEDVFLELVSARAAGAGSGTAAARGSERTAPRTPLARGTATAEDQRGGFAIRAERLSRRFGDFVAVDDVSFAIRYGEIVGLLGANGAGKTTVIKMLTGLLAPSSGSGHVAGMDMRRPGPALRRRIGYMSQAFSLYTDLTVHENIALYAGIYGLGRRETEARRAWIVELAGLERHLDTLAAALPMGLRQRLALGCALVHEPHLLFLDEPTSGVDPGGRRRFWEILFELARKDGVAVLVTTHVLAEAERCDEVVLMHAGKLVANASPRALKADVAREKGDVFELVATDPERLLAALARNGYDATPFARAAHIFVRDAERELPVLRAALAQARVELVSLEKKPLTLEDVFVRRIGQLERAESAA